MICQIILTKEENWIVATDVVTKIASQGKTNEEALRNIKEALELHYNDIPNSEIKIIIFRWDPKAKVWIAICDEIGLALESESYDALFMRVEEAVPELLKLNKITSPTTVTVSTEKTPD